MCVGWNKKERGANEAHIITGINLFNFSMNFFFCNKPTYLLNRWQIEFGGFRKQIF